MPQLSFQKKTDWDQAVENVGLATADSAVTLSAGATSLQLADDFNAASRDPLWLTHMDQVVNFQSLPSPTQPAVNTLNVPGVGAEKLAQTFTQPDSIPVSAIAVVLQARGTLAQTDSITVEIRTTSAGLPTTTVLASATVPVSQWTGDPVGSGPVFVVFPFTTPLNLTAGTVYVIVLNPSWTASSQKWAEATGDTRDLYAAGQGLRYNQSTSQWLPPINSIKDFYFRLYKLQARTKPTQAGGFLTFQYDATSGSPDHAHVTRNVAQGGMELEARFKRRLLSGTFNTGMFSIAILQGVRETVDGAPRETKVLHEFVMTITQNGIVNFTARIKNQSGSDVYAGDATWPVVVNQGMIAPDGQIFTLRITKSANGGITYFLFYSDNEANVLLQTQVSPSVRTLTGDVFAELGGPVGTNGAFGTAIDFDYIKLDTPPVMLTTGYLRLQHSFGVKTTLNSFDFGRLLALPGDTVQLQLRSGHTLADLLAASFGPAITTTPGSFDPSNPPAQWEKAVLTLPAAEFFESKILVTRSGASSPTVLAYNLTFTPTATTSPPPAAVNPLTLKRVINSVENWNNYVEKSPSISIVPSGAGGGMAILSAVYQDLFDGFSIDPEWAIYQRSASVYESFGFLRMAMLSTDCDTIAVKKTALPASYTATVQWLVQASDTLPAGPLFAANVLTLFNGPSQPVPNDLRYGGLAPGSHDTVIVRWLRKPDGSRRFSFIALRSDNVFVSWNGSAWVTGGAVDFVMTASKEATEWSFDLAVTNGALTIKARDDQGTVRFDTSAAPLQIKNGDFPCWLVLGDSNFEMPNQATFLYDAVLTNIPTSGPTSGYVRFRNNLGARGRLGKITIIPSTQIQTVPGKILLKARSAETLTDLLAAAFIQSAPFVPDILGSVLDLGVAPGAFLEVELDLFSASPGAEIVLFTWEIEPLIDDAPMIYSLNLIDANTTVGSTSVNTGVTEDQTTVPNIKDGDPNSQWISSAYQEGYSIQWVLNLGLMKNGVVYQDTIDTIILRNTNFDRIDIQLAQPGFTNPKVVFSGEIYTPDAIISFDPYLASMILITITSSQTPNDKKRLGEIYAGRFLAAMPGFDKYEPKRELLESGSLRTLGGKLIAYRGKDKYHAAWEISQVSQAAKDSLEAIFKANPLVTFLPEGKTRPRDLFNVAWGMTALEYQYSDVVKGAGFTLTGEFWEA
jgi:hypothetical protein